MKAKNLTETEIEEFRKVWYLEPLSDSGVRAIENEYKASPKAYANLKNRNLPTSFGLKRNVVCRDESARDLWVVDIDILTNIYETGEMRDGYKVWCSIGGNRPENFTDRIDLFIAPKLQDITWIGKVNKRAFSLAK